MRLRVVTVAYLYIIWQGLPNSTAVGIVAKRYPRRSICKLKQPISTIINERNCRFVRSDRLGSPPSEVILVLDLALGGSLTSEAIQVVVLLLDNASI